MIVEALISVLAGLFSAIGDMFGTIDVPDWVESIDTGMSTLGGYAGGLGHLLPFGAAIDGATFVLACIGLGLGIKIIRIIVSLFTAGGGSAA
jgi:hypothetical protein